MAQGHYLHLRLFLEGIEVPVIAANTQSVANAPAVATIQVVATDKVLDIYPRTVVHLFYYDYVEAGNAAIDFDAARLTGEDVDAFNNRFKLLFMGEVTTIQFKKTTGSRAVVLQCSDFSNYWDTTYQYNFKGQLFGGRRKAAFIGANANFFTSPLGHGTGTVSRLLNGRSVNYPELSGLLAGIVRMLEAIGGSYYGTNTFRGANDFASIAELRLKILQQITAADGDSSTAKLFARKAFNMWMNRRMGQLGTLVSFRGLLKMLFKFIFHEVYPCPVARYVPAGKRTETRRFSQSLTQSSQYKGFANRVNSALNYSVIAVEDLKDWRKIGGDAAQKRNKAQAYLRSYLQAERAITHIYVLGNTISGRTGVNIQKELACAHTAIRKIGGMTFNRGEVASANHPMGLGTLDRNYESIKALWANVEDALGAILGIKIKRSSRRQLDTQPRVNNQIFRPDIFFAPPPRCNVLFPETYDTFNFSRQYLREVSRLELQTHNEILGNSALFNGRYYAPNVEDVRRGVKLSSRRFAQLIMDHELFTGIIPMFENMTEVNLFAMRSGKIKKGGAKVGYAQRAVNFQYFRYRFQSRGMDVTGRFNPMAVPGFPALIIDKPMDSVKLAIAALPVENQVKSLGLTAGASEIKQSDVLQQLVSPQYVGVVSSLSHSVSQDGGRTAYTFQQARVHRESTELLGVDRATVRKVVGKATRETVVAAVPSESPKKGKRGHRGGSITKVVDVTKSNGGRLAPKFGCREKVRVGDAGSVTSATEDAERFRAYLVIETVSRFAKEKVDRPIEDAIRPPWIWDGWANPKIGETYLQFFGTTAITDITGFNVPTTNVFFIGEDEHKAIEQKRSVIDSGKGKKSAAASGSPRGDQLTKEYLDQNAVLAQEKETTSENSIDYLVRAYSFIRVNNLDVGDFLRAYSWRPVATMVEILGGSDFQLNRTTRTVNKVVRQRIKRSGGGKSGTKAVYSTKLVKRPVNITSYQAEGTEGFHSRAFGDLEDLFGLVSPTVTRVLKLSGSKRKVAARLDVRKRRRDAIRSYVEELTGSRGLIG